ncbi:MAG: D-alanine--D-alanine ligase [Promethearchaeota archaeon]|nr:MAG: D-alanine--D-alanine ligase [Candidatus Lokiarchaeota archaeon]
MNKTNGNENSYKNLKKESKQNNLKHTTFGPIENLEEYVNTDWWKNLFNSNYLKTDGDVVNDPEITSHEVNLLINLLNLKENDRILDLCCGQGRHLIELSKRGFNHLYGLDQSSFLIRKAKSTALKEACAIRFKEGDARKLPYPLDYFDYVMILGNSFGYFESKQDDLKVLKEVRRVLKPYGTIFLDLTDGEYLAKNYSPRSWEWINKRFFVCRERSLSLDKDRLISREVITDVNQGVIADQFYAERLYTKEKIIELLKVATYLEPVFHGELSANSKKNQDLGMMEKRILVSSRVQKEWTPKKPRKEVKNVIVLMGDPNKTDIVKPSHVFDEDDMYTINELKSALHELDDYNFTYLDNHDTLIWDLTKKRNKIDFILNLCDEGYYNDARNELHIPALLEILKIPYTGGGPQCLAFCYDKSLVRGIAKEMNIPVGDGIYVKQEDFTYQFLPFNFPVLVKPNFGDSSFGITQNSYVENGEGLVNIINEIRQKFGYDKPILIEEFLPGADLSVGIIGNPDETYRVLTITEEDYSELPEDIPKICGYEAKWMPDSPYWNIKSIPARIDDQKKHFIIDCCVKLFKRLECRDYCRFDWRLDAQGNPKLLEVNPNPGWCWDGHLVKMAKIDGLSYSDMLKEILEAAERRIGLRTSQEELEKSDQECKIIDKKSSKDPIIST